VWSSPIFSRVWTALRLALTRLVEALQAQGCPPGVRIATYWLGCSNAGGDKRIVRAILDGVFGPSPYVVHIYTGGVAPTASPAASTSPSAALASMTPPRPSPRVVRADRRGNSGGRGSTPPPVAAMPAPTPSPTVPPQRPSPRLKVVRPEKPPQEPTPPAATTTAATTATTAAATPPPATTAAPTPVAATTATVTPTSEVETKTKKKLNIVRKKPQ